MSIGLPYSCFFCPNLILSVRYIWEKTDYLWSVIYKKGHRNAHCVGFADTSQRGGEAVTPVTSSLPPSRPIYQTRRRFPSRGKWHEVPIGAFYSSDCFTSLFLICRKAPSVLALLGHLPRMRAVKSLHPSPRRFPLSGEVVLSVAKNR